METMWSEARASEWRDPWGSLAPKLAHCDTSRHHAALSLRLPTQEWGQWSSSICVKVLQQMVGLTSQASMILPSTWRSWKHKHCICQIVFLGVCKVEVKRRSNSRGGECCQGSSQGCACCGGKLSQPSVHWASLSTATWAGVAATVVWPMRQGAAPWLLLQLFLLRAPDSLSKYQTLSLLQVLI